jgi:RNA polymerase sigma-70 factor (ECF subfamily)
VPAFARALHGRRRVTRALGSWIAVGRRAGGLEVRQLEVNGQPGAVISDTDGGLIAVWSLDITQDRVQSIRSVVNPDKLAPLGPVSGLMTALERARQRRG